MDFQKYKINLDEIDFWQQRCSDFWNLFYSYLVLNQYNINILNLNFYIEESGTISFVNNINLINYIETKDTTPQVGKIYYVLSDGKYNEAVLTGDPAEFKEEDKPYYEINPMHYIKTKDTTPQVGKIYYVLSDGKYNEAVLTGDPAEFKEEDKPYYEFNFNNNIINLLLQKQQFEINNQYYEIPQNFLGIEFCETNSLIQILFYYFDENKQTDDPQIKKYYKITEDTEPQVGKIYYILNDNEYNEIVFSGDSPTFVDDIYYEQIPIYENYFNPFDISGGES